MAKGDRTPKIYRFKDRLGNEKALTEKEKSFCDIYLGNGGDRADAIYEAGYKPKSKKHAWVMAFNILKRPDIAAYIHSRLEQAGYNNKDVDKELLHLMNQSGDLTNKLGAVKEFNKLSGRYPATRIKFEDELDDYDDDEIEAELAQRLHKRTARIRKDNKGKK